MDEAKAGMAPRPSTDGAGRDLVFRPLDQWRVMTCACACVPASPAVIATMSPSVVLVQSCDSTGSNASFLHSQGPG